MKDSVIELPADVLARAIEDAEADATIVRAHPTGDMKVSAALLVSDFTDGVKVLVHLAAAAVEHARALADVLDVEERPDGELWIFHGFAVTGGLTRFDEIDR